MKVKIVDWFEYSTARCEEWYDTSTDLEPTQFFQDAITIQNLLMVKLFQKSK